MIEIGLIYDVNSSLSVIGDKGMLFSKSYKKDILKVWASCSSSFSPFSL